MREKKCGLRFFIPYLKVFQLKSNHNPASYEVYRKNRGGVKTCDGTCTCQHMHKSI